MELLILGSGTCEQSSSRVCAGYLLKTQGKTFLLDAGPGILSQLSRHGVNVADIDEIFITHTHIDHVNDLPAILFTRKHCANADPNKELIIHGPEGFTEEFKAIRKAYGSQIDNTGLSIKVMEHPAEPEESEEEAEEEDLPEVYSVGLLNVTTKPMKHSRPTIGYRFDYLEEAGGEPVKSLTYSGDTEPCNNIIRLAMNTDCLLMEASTSDENPKPGHTATSQAAAVANRASAKSLMLTHISPENDETDIENTASQFYDGIVILVRDGMRLTV